MAKGRVVQVLGGVVDVEFPPDQMPEIYEAVEVPREDQEPLVLEVEKHLGNSWVRCVAMDTTDGLQRGRTAEQHRRADPGAGGTRDARARLQRARQAGG